LPLAIRVDVAQQLNANCRENFSAFVHRPASHHPGRDQTEVNIAQILSGRHGEQRAQGGPLPFVRAPGAVVEYREVIASWIELNQLKSSVVVRWQCEDSSGPSSLVSTDLSLSSRLARLRSAALMHAREVTHTCSM
jgi:hypothetical protein